MHKKNVLKNILKIVVVIVILCSELGGSMSVYASDLSFYNHNTKSNVKYTGKQVSYIYNNRTVSLSYPGIILNGYAMADYEELFVGALGLSATLEEKALTLTDGKTTLELTIGSKNVKINGKSQKMSIAPVKLEFSEGVIKYYVPSRFVAETFGINYIWNSTNSQVKLTKTLQLLVNEKTVLYSNTLYYASYNSKDITPDSAIFTYESQIYAPAKALFESLGCKYTEQDKNIIISKGEIVLSLEIDSCNVTVNDIPFTMEEAPVGVSDAARTSNKVYVPLEFVAKMLGFEFSYDETTCNFNFRDTEYTGQPELHPDLKDFYQTKIILHDQEPLETYFLWSSEEVSELEGIKNLTKIRAYSIENADVIELYGVTRDDINDFMDSRTIVFEMKNVLSNMDTKFFGDFETPHLNYVLLTTVNLITKLFIMAPIEDEWLFEETEECLKIYFMPSDLTLEDLKIYEEQTHINTVNNNETTYPENQFYLTLPDGFDVKKITVYDDYSNKKIKVYFPGNLTGFFEKNAPVNPYDFVKKTEIVYDETTNQTILTITTNYICGYKSTYKDDYFAINLAKPSEIYNKIIVLDAGHGGKDPGAVRSNVYEKTINFDIINYTQELFESTDIKVYLTRTKDKFISLQDRTKFVKEVDADLFISLHMNASEYETASGTEIFYSKANNSATEYGLTSYKLGKKLIDNISEAMDTKSRGVSKAEYHVIDNNSVPAVLIELGFISNKAERTKLVDKTYQQKVAKAIYESVIDVFCTYPTGR